MSEGGKFVVRPKVRFCQWEDESEDQEYEKSQNDPLLVKKPTIKNIVSVDKPYKIVSLDKKASPEEHFLNAKKWSENGLNGLENDFKDQKNIYNDQKNCYYQENGYDGHKNHNFEDFRHFSPKEYEFIDNQVYSVDSSFSSKEEISQNPKLVEVEIHAEDISDTQVQNVPHFPEETQAFINTKEHLFRDSEDSVLHLKSPEKSPKFPEKKNLSAIEEEILEFDVSPKNKSPEPLKVPEEFLVTKQVSIPKSPKKNFKTLGKRQSNSVNRLSKAKSPKKIPQENPRLSANPKFRSRPLGFIQRSSTTPKVAGIMPCMKAKVSAKGKISPVKKTVLRNVTVKPGKISVEPGVSRPKKDLKMSFEEERKVNSFHSEKLSKPEYNSIMCTINKLKEVQKENIITDVEHLPPIYKSLVNEKVTSSLDFLPDEAIFKNLINLSIDEAYLPTRMTRSKDPEPRQRDAVPKLSDFFVPKYANEYCTAVCAKPRSPEPLENWSAFRISDKIRSWKWNMDFVH